MHGWLSGAPGLLVEPLQEERQSTQMTPDMGDKTLYCAASDTGGGAQHRNLFSAALPGGPRLTQTFRHQAGTWIQSRNPPFPVMNPSPAQALLLMLFALHNRLPWGWVTKEMLKMEPARLCHPFGSSPCLRVSSCALSPRSLLMSHQRGLEDVGCPEASTVSRPSALCLGI